MENLKLRDSTIILENIDNTHEILQAMDIMVFPSLYEGLAMALLEAQATGLECIISDNISKDVFVTDKVKSISLEEDIIVWVSQIKKILKTAERIYIY